MRWGRPSSLVHAVVLAAVITACGTRSEPVPSTAAATLPAGPLTTTTTSTTPSPTTAQPTLDEVAAPDGLAVLGTDGVVRVAADGRLVPAEADPHLSAQPTWAPDGRRLAWVEFDSEGRPGLAVADGPDTTHHSLPFGAFYLFWSPDGRKLAFLGNNPVTLGMVDVASGDVTALDSGSPYYFDWAPGSDRLLTHIGGVGIGIGPPGMPDETFAQASVAFLAPDWTPDGSGVVYVRGADGEGLSAAAGRQAAQEVPVRTLVHHDLESGTITELVEFSGRISFAISPNGERIAYSITGGGEPLNFGPLTSIDLLGGDPVTISPLDVLAFDWSPASDRLAFLTPNDDGTALRWAVGDGSSVQRFDSIVPSQTYLQSYLPFFDQYARSMTIWAPDGSAIAFPVSTPEGEQIWLQTLDGRRPGLVGPGVMAVFAPPGG